MPEIVSVKLSEIGPNPMRQLDVYPYNEAKLTALQHSIHDVGLWPTIIARRHDNRIQLAFGHHRVEASRREFGSDASISLVLQDLTDEQMIKFMGRENMEDYNADFMVMLETWDAAEKFLFPPEELNRQAPDVARLLGWTRPHPQRDGDMMDHTAEACNAASKLLRGNYLKRADLVGLTVSDALKLTTKAVSLHKELDRNAKAFGRDAKDVEEGKRLVGKAAAKTATEVREGKIAKSDLGTRVSTNSYRAGQKAKRQVPLFDVFAKELMTQLDKVAERDSIGDKLEDIVRAIRTGNVHMREDVDTIARVARQCGRVKARFAAWESKLVYPQARTAVKEAPRSLPVGSSKLLGVRR